MFCLSVHGCLPETHVAMVSTLLSSSSSQSTPPTIKSLIKTLQSIKFEFFSDPPISPNPSTENLNATCILLKWSPPFLWPGYSIDYYNISIMNNGSTYSHTRNATFNDALVSFMIYAEDNDMHVQSCHVLEILLSAVSSDAERLTAFDVYGGFIPSA